MGSVIRRDAGAIVVAGLLCGLVTALPPFSMVHGWSIDILTALRWEIFGKRHDPASSPAVVVAIDEETYETPPFKTSPTISIVESSQSCGTISSTILPSEPDQIFSCGQVAL